MNNYTLDGQYISPLYVRARASFTKAWRWRTGEPLEPVNFLGWEAVCHVRKRLKDQLVLLELTTGNGRIQLSNEGHVLLTMTPDDTEVLETLRRAVYDVKLIYPPTGFVKVFAGGPVIITPTTTRRI